MSDHVWTDEDVEELAYGLTVAAGEDDDPSDTQQQAWQQVTRSALESAEIEVTKEEFERAWRCAWQRSGMGEGSTPDAEAILKAIGGDRD